MRQSLEPIDACQVVEEAQAIGDHCNLKASVWTGEGPHAVQANAYRTAGQLVVSTPGRIAQALQTGLIQSNLLSRTLGTFVLDEADLLLLHEYEADLQAIAPQVLSMQLEYVLTPDTQHLLLYHRALLIFVTVCVNIHKGGHALHILSEHKGLTYH